MWNSVGLKGNPYFGEPLGVSDDTKRLFVGRTNDIKQLVVSISSENRIIFIGGINGSGKTTFLNYFQWISYISRQSEPTINMPKVLPAFKTIQIRSEETYIEFLHKILHGIVSSISMHCRMQRCKTPKRVQSIERAINAEQSEGKSWNGGATILGVGLTAGRSSNPNLRDGPLGRETSLIEMIAELARVAIKEIDIDGIAVAVDNIESVKPEKLREILNYARDSCLSIEGLQWYFLGQSDIGSQIYLNVPRLRGYMATDSINLRPMSTDDFLRALELRRLFLKEFTAPLPINEDTSASIYGASGGDLRFTFGICTALVEKAFSAGVRLPIADDIADVMLHQMIKQNMHQLIKSPRIGDFVRNWIEIGSKEIYEVNYAELGLTSVIEFATIVSELEDMQIVWREISVHGVASFRPRGFMILAQKYAFSI